MRVVVFGANGKIGQCIVREAASRGHTVVAAVRDPSRAPAFEGEVVVTAGDATDASSVNSLARGADAIASAVGNTTAPVHEAVNPLFASAARALLAGSRTASVSRLLILGGAGSLEVAPGVQVVDTPGFPVAYRADALGQRAALDVYRSAASDGVDWTYVSPSAEIAPGTRTGRYRTGTDQLLRDAANRSWISYEDYAVAFVDELEAHRHPARRITVGY